MQYSDEIVIFFFYLLKIATIFNPFLSFFIGLIRDIKKNNGKQISWHTTLEIYSNLKNSPG